MPPRFCRHRLWINDTVPTILATAVDMKAPAIIEPTGHEDGRRGTHDTSRDHGRNGIGALSCHPLEKSKSKAKTTTTNKSPLSSAMTAAFYLAY